MLTGRLNALGAASCCLTALLLAVSSARGAGTNLLVNGDFEAPPPQGGGLPAGWKASDFSTNGVAVVAGGRAEGKAGNCLKLEGRGCGIFSELVSLNPNESLRFSGWLNSHDPVTPKSPIYVGLAWYDASREPLSSGAAGKGNFLYVPMPKGEGWRSFEVIVPPKFTLGKQVIPAGAVYVEVRIFLLEYPGRVLFDDLSLVQN